MREFLFKRRSKYWKTLKRDLAAYSLVIPSLVVLGIFTIYSIVNLFGLSFVDYSLVTLTSKFIGFDNYYRVFVKDPVFWIALRNTLIYVGGVTFSSCLLGLIVAVLLRQLMYKFLQNTLKVMFYIPVVVSAVAGSLIWRHIYASEYGLLNYFLERFLGLSPPAWLLDKTWALPAIIIMGVWRDLGFNMVIFLAGLTVIPDVQYEAAGIDGANKLRMFWDITVPLLRPIVYFVVVTGIIRTFQLFAQVNLMTKGGPGYATNVIVYRVYQVSFQYLNLGVGAAMSVVLFIFILIATLIQVKFIRASLT